MTRTSQTTTAPAVPIGTAGLRSVQSTGQSRLAQALAKMGIVTDSSEALLRSLPFTGHDTTAGSESELQAAVVGPGTKVDLPKSIRASNYYANLLRRTRSGDLPRDLISSIESFIDQNTGDVWENSWVTCSAERLSAYALNVFRVDLRADKRNPSSQQRTDTHRFIRVDLESDTQLRIPVSYLLKLSLADAISRQTGLPVPLFAAAEKLLDHFQNDNTSPETFSFHVVAQNATAGSGQAIARETNRRFLLTQLLLQYANKAFGLEQSGQRAMVYFAPHPPQRQKELNGIVPDNFYRSLFMSPCLSGWDEGESKSDYMHLCHQVLSRSQLNAVAKLKEAGIIVNNLVVMPNVSNTSLANNGTHISLGSQRLTRLQQAGEFGAEEEKLVGDLTVKVVEHFMPLFVGTCSAAPYRLGFEDFHPEKVLGFLPHQLDYTHLRMLWRRWRKKASLSVFGNPVTPFGPVWFDRMFSRTFGLKGDYVPDFRLIDYPVWLLSTDQSPASDGRIGNHDQLKSDLSDMGVFDKKMSLYLVYKLREFEKMGFSGFEGRQYSLFAEMQSDMGCAASLQQLITALAFKYMASGQINHRHIPDSPVLESERRQMFFNAASGVPTFYVRSNSRNILLRRILRHTDKVRTSRRYPGYWRVLTEEYRKALLKTIQIDGADLIEMMQMREVVRDLEQRILHPETSAFGKLTRGILNERQATDPLQESAEGFNRSAEHYYRGGLRQSHMNEALDTLLNDLQQLHADADPLVLAGIQQVFKTRDPLSWLKTVRKEALSETLPRPQLHQLVMLLIIMIVRDSNIARSSLKESQTHATASVY